jgi:hypothetical protein
MTEYTVRLKDFEFDEPETADDAGPGSPDPTKVRGNGPSSRGSPHVPAGSR